MNRAEIAHRFVSTSIPAEAFEAEELGYGYLPDTGSLEIKIEERRHKRITLAGGAIINPGLRSIRRNENGGIEYDWENPSLPDVHVYVSPRGGIKIINPY